ncbi:hypothetical protein BH23CHL8_BH23CHL8_03360 [soil metagenome]
MKGTPDEAAHAPHSTARDPGDGLAIIANEEPFGRIWRFAVWISADGLRWRKAGTRGVRAPAGFKDDRRIVHGYWSIDGRLVALESHTRQPCCGTRPDGTFLAAQRSETRRGGRDATFTWTTRDGRRWVRKRAHGLRHYPGTHAGHHTYQGDGELLAIWTDGPLAMGRSTNGVTWETLGPIPPELDTTSSAVLVRTPTGFALAGERSDGPPGPGNHLTAWSGEPDGAWSRTLDRASSSPSSVIVDGSTVIMAGTELDLESIDDDDPTRLPWLVVSTDGGVRWDDSLAWTGSREPCLGPLAARGGTVVIGAQCPPPGVATMYATDLVVEDPAPATGTSLDTAALDSDTHLDEHEQRQGPGGHRSP